MANGRSSTEALGRAAKPFWSEKRTEVTTKLRDRQVKSRAKSTEDKSNSMCKGPEARREQHTREDGQLVGGAGAYSGRARSQGWGEIRLAKWAGVR